MIGTPTIPDPAEIARQQAITAQQDAYDKEVREREAAHLADIERQFAELADDLRGYVFNDNALTYDDWTRIPQDTPWAVGNPGLYRQCIVKPYAYHHHDAYSHIRRRLGIPNDLFLRRWRITQQPQQDAQRATQPQPPQDAP